MQPGHTAQLEIVVLVTPHFNVSATTSFTDPFRVSNYLTGTTGFSWSFVSQSGGDIEASNGLIVTTKPLDAVLDRKPWLVVLSSSWTPERYTSAKLRAALQKWARNGAIIGGLDTGGIILANAGLLKGKTATVHYEHIDAFIEIAAETTVSENMIVFDDRIFTCCGGTASTDAGLRFVHAVAGENVANAAARYLFHHNVRGEDQSQNPKAIEPLGYVTSGTVRSAIDLMEAHLEKTLTIPEIAAEIGISARQLGRLFRQYVQKSPCPLPDNLGHLRLGVSGELRPSCF